MNNRFWRRILIDWSTPLTFFFIALALWGGYVSKDIELKLSLTDLLPQDNPAVTKFNKLTEIVGGVGYTEILLHAKDKKSHLEIAQKIVDEMKTSALVRSAFFHREEHFFLTRALYYADMTKLTELEKTVDTGIQTAKRKAFDIGLWEDDKTKKEEPKKLDPEFKKFADRTERLSPYLLSADGEHLLVMVKPSFDSLDMKKSKELVKFTEETLKRVIPTDKIEYVISGRYFSKVKDAEVIEEDIFILGILSNVVMAIVLLLYFRSIAAVISIFTPVVLGLGVTALITRYTIGHVNIITGFLVGMLAGVGSDYGIHLLWRIRLEQREASSAEPDVLWRTLLTCGWANFVTLVTTSLCLFLMCGSNFKVFSEFGFMAGVGLGAILITKMCTFYCTSKWLNLEKVMTREKFPFHGWRLPMLESKRSYVIALVVTGLLSIYMVKVGFEFDFEKMLEHSQSIRIAEKMIDDIYDRSTTPSAFAANSKEEAVAIEKFLKDHYMPSIVSSVVSGGSIIPPDQQEKSIIVGRIRKRIEKLSDRSIREGAGAPAKSIRDWVNAKPFDWADLPVYVQEALRGQKQSQYLLYVYPTEHLNTGGAVNRFAGMINDVDAHFPDIVSGSDAGIFSEILELIKRDGLVLMMLIVVLIGVFIWINLRDLTHTLLSYVSFLISMPLGIGLMALFGVKFNIFNVALLPVFIAAGIEIPIQLMQRAGEIKSGYKGVHDIAVSLQLSLLTTLVGFGVLIFTRAGILKSLGWMSILMILSGWWVGLFIHPAILERYFIWEKKRHARCAKSGHAPV